MTGGNGTTTPIPPPVIAHYATIYADLITPLAVMLSDDYQEHWIFDVNADDVTQADLSGMERRIPALEQELKEVQKVSNDLTSFGKKWMDEAAKHPQAAREGEVDKYDQLRTNHDVPTLIGRAAVRMRELKQAIGNMMRLHDKCSANFERQGGTAGPRSRTVFPNVMGAFGATTSGSSNRRPAGASFDGSASSADADEPAYTSSFFRDGELELLIAKTPASDKQLKVVNQPIETFKGDITKFPIFRQQFLREAHRPGRDMDDTDRFTYLLSLLEGPAKQLVSGIKPLKGCYQLAVETLQQRYGNEDELYRHLLRELKQLKSLQTGYTAHQIEQFTMMVVQTLASIADLGRADTSGRTLEEVEEKLPPDLREKIQERRLYDPKWDVIKLHHFLMDRAAILRAIHGDQSRHSSQDSAKVKTAVTTSAQPRQDPKTVRFSRGPANKDRLQTSTPKCVFCPSTEHWGSKCPKYVTLGQRYQRILQLKRCYICLNEHNADSCRHPTARECRLCNEKHHICFCPARYESERKASKTHSSTNSDQYEDYEEPESGTDVSDQASSDADDFDDTEDSAESHGTHAILSNKDNGTHQTTLLECVEVTVGHPTIKGRQCKTVLVFDSCSTQSYIKKSLVKKLQLPQLNPTKLSIGTFMSADDMTVDTFYTQLRIRRNDGKTIDIRAPAMDRLCGKVQSVFIQADEEAEVREGSCALRSSTETPEILIGRDLRSVFKILEDHQPLPSGFVISRSNVGSMLVGRGLAERASTNSEVSDKALYVQDTVIEPRRDVSFGQLLNGHADIPDLDDVLKDLLGQMQATVRHTVSHAKGQSEADSDEKLESILHQLYSLEQMGVELPDQFNEEDAVHQRIRNSIRWVEGRYEIGLPWRTADGKAPSNKELPDNFAYAFACLQALIKTRSKSPELLAEYDRIFKEYLASGIISEVTKDCQCTAHYLSHHAVLKKGSATTKVRPVFNGSAKPDKASPSLNDMLHKGPLLLNPITAVLLNSRLAPYVLSAYIAKAFLQISLLEEDRHVCRFLWVRDITKPPTGNNLVIYCFNRVLFGLRPSPALLGVTIEHHMQKLDTKLSREILANCYVDNIYLTADDLVEASAKYQSSKEIFANMNMNLREFATNDTSFNASLPKDDQARFEGFKQLGIHWDLNADEWVFDFKVGSLDENWSPKTRRGRKKCSTTTSLKPTKRLMSSTMLSRFDPLGLVNPAILPARLAVQAACKAKYGWDDPVDTDLVDQWNKAVECWSNTEIRVPRLIKPKGDEVVELHVFCDASGYSYGACAYLTVQTTDGSRSSHLVFSRSRLKPLNTTLTIPRLELMAAVLGVRLIAFLQTQLTTKVSNVTLWTDSQVVFFWAQSEQKQPVFVENRLKEIRTLKELHQIQLKYVPTDQNPADVLSRGISAAKLQDHTLWWNGPQFLTSIDQWPVQPTHTEYVESEPSFEQVLERELSLATSAKWTRLNYIVDPAEFNDWRKFLYRTYAYLFKTVSFLRALAVKRRTLSWIPAALRKLVEDTNLFKPDDMASLKDLQATESLIVQTTQAVHPPSADDERQLRLQYDADGLLRANSRLTKAQGIPTSAYNPIYLPRKARVTALLIHFHHDPARHLGTNAILASLRRRFWFTSGRRTVQTAVKLLCKECAIWNAKPLKIPEWPVLPASRVNQFKPFSHIGLDNFGSYTVRDVLEGKTGHRKVWVLIVSCLTTRAIWMDVVTDMSAESFINSFKRHMASNGTPFSVICDNATNFVAGGEALKRVTSTHQSVEPADGLRRSLRATVRQRQLKEWMQEEVADEVTQPSVDFKHIPEYAPWRGATYERLIGNAKYCLKRTIGRKLLALDEFRTLISEVTRAVNERPIAYMSERVDEFTLLRPIDFLAPLSQDRPVINPPINHTPASDARDPSHQPKKLTAVDKLVVMWTEQSQRMQTFWNMWHEMVLLSSLERATRPDKTTDNKRPKGQVVHHLIGQYVLVKDDNTPQYKWKRAEILDLIESSDGVIRTASIRLPSGTISRRAINHLYPIEVELEPCMHETTSFCSVTRVISGSTMDISKIGLHEPVELDYDESMDTLELTDAAGADVVAKGQTQTSSSARKCFEIDGRVVLPASGPIPLLDSHLHADEVQALASSHGVIPPTFDHWSRDAALGQVYQFAGYITVFCRPNTFLSDERVNRVSEYAYYPLEKCLGACVGVHPGNSEDWHQDDELELQLVGILLKGSLGQYPLVGLGECGLDYTKKAVVRDADGRIQTRNGEPALSHAIGAKHNHQRPVFEAQLKLARQLRRPDGSHYPLVLHLRDKESMNTDVQRDALQLMMEAKLPADYPIHFHFWVGNRVQYENWMSHYPRALFGYNSSFFKRSLTKGQLELLQTIPLDSVTFESDAPHHGTEGTSQNLGTSAGLVFAIQKFRELGKRRADERTIALKSMENVIRLYRPDLTIVALPVPDLSVAPANATLQKTSIPEEASASRPVNSHGTQTMYELNAVCDGGRFGLHVRCATIHLVGDPYHDGAILAQDWKRATRNIADADDLRQRKVLSTTQLILCCWGGRLLRDQPQEVVQFLRELVTSPPKEAAAILDRWYSRITASSTLYFRRVQESDVNLALRKRFHGCFEAHDWLKHAEPPFEYKFQLGKETLQTEVLDVFDTIRRMMPEALSATFHQFVLKHIPQEVQFDPVEDLQLVEEEWYDDPDQPGPSRKSRQVERCQYQASKIYQYQASKGCQYQASNRHKSVQRRRFTKRLQTTSHLGTKKRAGDRRTQKLNSEIPNELLRQMIALYLENTDDSSRGPDQKCQPRYPQERGHRGARD